MKFKKNDGFVGVDVSIAMVILLILVPTITGIIYNINKTNNSINLKTQATSIAVEVLETAKGISIENLTAEELGTEILGYSNYSVTDTTEDSTSSTHSFILEPTSGNKNQYTLDVTITDYHETNSDAEENVVKTVKAVVKYRVGGETQELELSTVVSIE